LASLVDDVALRLLASHGPRVGHVVVGEGPDDLVALCDRLAGAATDKQFYFHFLSKRGRFYNQFNSNIRSIDLFTCHFP
jgi:hypothetical protein